MRSSSAFWGVVLLLLGGLFLLGNLGILAIDIWKVIGPLFLILLGAWFLIGATIGRRALPTQQASIPLEGAAHADVHVQHGAGRLEIRAGAESGSLASGSFSGGLRFETRREGDRLVARMRVGEQGVWGFPWTWAPRGLEWSFGLNQEIPIALRLETGASESQLDLRDLRLSEFSLKTGASSTVLTLPAAAGMTKASIQGGAASVSIRIPEGVAASILARGGLAGISVDTQRFPRAGDRYQSPDYESAANRVDLHVEIGAGAVDVR